MVMGSRSQTVEVPAENTEMVRVNGVSEVSTCCDKTGSTEVIPCEPDTPIVEKTPSCIIVGSRVAAVCIAVISLFITEGAIVFSRKTTCMLPLTNGQVMCLLVFSYFIGLWIVVQLAGGLSYVKNCNTSYNLTTGSYALSWKRHLSKYITDDNLTNLSASAEFAGIMIIYYLCDRTELFGHTEKHYNRDLYWFIFVCLVAASLATIRKSKHTGHVMLLQRDQTEEWKGWMQVQFLFYHYFHATEYYSAIRCYIAAYVWMTGFGNFSYYYIKKDFSFSRFCGMQWRLNFFAFWCCLVLENEYMLYYICMLHTTFTVFIYIGLGIFYEKNYTNTGIFAKFVFLIVIAAIVWDIPGVFDIVWAPFRWLVDYNGKLFEWSFRSHLDHLIWIFGMLTAFTHPRSDALLEQLDQMPFRIQYAIKAIVVAVCLVLIRYWYIYVFCMSKGQYNNYHPFTSFIPITTYVILRNISSRLRRYHLELFAWLGKITLETYISQFHVWLSSAGPNTNPKRLLRILPEGYPLLNFFLVSCFYVYFSYRVFQISGTLKRCVVPSKDNARLKRNVITCVISGAALYFLALVLNTTTKMYL
jgi:hypothetical protein